MRDVDDVDVVENSDRGAATKLVDDVLESAMRGLALRLGFHIEREPGDATVVQLHMALNGERSGRPRAAQSGPVVGTRAPTVARTAVAFAFDEEDFRVGRWDNKDILMS